MNQKIEHRVIRGAARTAEVRTARHEDRDWIVIPVIALVGDIVIRPMGSKRPEFVPADVLAEAPGQWANRPVVPDHPTDKSGPITANSPHVLEGQAFGKLFHPEFKGGRLHVEAWLDPLRATVVGGDALRVLEIAERALAGEEVEPVEVSVGVFVTLVEEDGIAPNGDRYEFTWAGAWADHLAVGLNGSEGACSVEAGCGGFRAACAGSDDAASPPDSYVLALRRSGREAAAADLETKMANARRRDAAALRRDAERPRPEQDTTRVVNGWAAALAATTGRSYDEIDAAMRGERNAA